MIKKGDTIPGIFSLTIGLFALIYNFARPQMAIFGESVRGGIGPGFFPFICGIALVLFGVMLVLRGIRQNGSVDYFQITPERKQNLKLVGLLTLFVALMLAGWKLSELFFLCLPIYCFVVNRVLKQSVKFSVLFTIVMTVFIYALFRVAFTIRFKP